MGQIWADQTPLLPEQCMRILYAPVPTFSLSPSKGILVISNSFTQAFGWNGPEVRGKRLTDFLEELDDAHPVSTAYSQLWDDGHCSSLPFKWRCKDGELLAVLLSAQVIPHNDQQLVYVGLAVLPGYFQPAASPDH